MDLNIVLGCHGREEASGFNMCDSVENVIVEIRPDTPNREDLMDYIDEVAGMCDADVFDWNKIMNIISHLSNVYSCINRERLMEIQLFNKMHKPCGVYLRLVPA